MAISRRRKLAVAMAGAVVLAGSGGAYAATQQPGATSPPDPAAEQKAFLDDVAGRLHVSTDELTAALKSAAADRLVAAVKAGRLTQDQADKLKQRIERANGLPLPHALGPGPGRLGFGRGFGGPGPVIGGLDGAARYLGVTVPQLFSDLRAGKSLADVAKAQHKTVDGLKAAIKADETARLDQAVKDGRLTAAERSRIESGLDQRLDDLINRTPPAGGPRVHGPHFRWP